MIYTKFIYIYIYMLIDPPKNNHFKTMGMQDLLRVDDN